MGFVPEIGSAARGHPTACAERGLAAPLASSASPATAETAMSLAIPRETLPT
jgi:hypothetical protein